MAYKKHKQYRLYGFDYSGNGSYFITIVTQNRFHYFGKIENAAMNLSAVGLFVQQNIENFIINHQLPNPLINNFYFKNNIENIIGISQYAIMPNHLHLIVEIINKNKTDWQFPIGLQPLIKGSVSSFINQFKGKISKWAKEQNIEFAWQSRFHDRIIRDDDEHYRIWHYIENNVINWNNDAENL